VAQRPYSERFIRMHDEAGARYYTVPPGRRASVKMVSVANPARVAGTVGVLVAEQYVYIRDVQATQAFESLSMMSIAYAGERIGIYVGAASMAVMVCGFLYSETVAAALLPDMPESELELDPPPPLLPPP
jgi:hypothetical protein